MANGSAVAAAADIITGSRRPLHPAVLLYPSFRLAEYQKPARRQGACAYRHLGDIWRKVSGSCAHTCRIRTRTHWLWACTRHSGIRPALAQDGFTTPFVVGPVLSRQSPMSGMRVELSPEKESQQYIISRIGTRRKLDESPYSVG